MSRTPRWPLVVALLTLGTAAPAHAMDLKLSPRFEHVQPMAPGADEPLLLPGPSAPQAEALYAAATQAVMRGDVSAAEMACRQAIDLSPGHCDARTALAGLCYDRRDVYVRPYIYTIVHGARALARCLLASGCILV